nr:hypothetical protein CFP56_04413 [Quercus suber]
MGSRQPRARQNEAKHTGRIDIRNRPIAGKVDDCRLAVRAMYPTTSAAPSAWCRMKTDKGPQPPMCQRELSSLTLPVLYFTVPLQVTLANMAALFPPDGSERHNGTAGWRRISTDPARVTPDNFVNNLMQCPARRTRASHLAAAAPIRCTRMGAPRQKSLQRRHPPASPL